jgi:hypothetical protein
MPGTMVRPMTSFCCGCPLAFGVALVILLNFVQNIFYIVTATMNIILRIPTVGAGGGLISQTFNAAWCLLGLPFIFAAIWGMIYKQESNVRLYLCYMIVSFSLDVFYIFAFFATTDMCTSIPTALRQHGTAFACGFMRLLSLSFIMAMLIVVTYFIFTVWSYCEDMKAGGQGAGFPALLAGAGEMRIKRRQAYGGAQFGDTYGGYGNTDAMGFGRYKAPGLNGERIFNVSDFHETKFPPERQF